MTPKNILLQLMHIFIKVANHAALLLPGRSASATQNKLGNQIFDRVLRDEPDILEGWRSGKFVEMYNTALSGKMIVLAGLLNLMESKQEKVHL